MFGSAYVGGSQYLVPGQGIPSPRNLLEMSLWGRPLAGCGSVSPGAGADAGSGLRTTDLGECWFE